VHFLRIWTEGANGGFSGVSTQLRSLRFCGGLYWVFLGGEFTGDLTERQTDRSTNGPCRNYILAVLFGHTRFLKFFQLFSNSPEILFVKKVQRLKFDTAA
jgi:hypothetical protein